jgi:undecaprenyl-phosphate galactose phosphotransferase
MILVWIFIFAYEGLYSKRFTFWDEARELVKGTTISFFLIMRLTFIARKSLQVSRTVIVLAWFISLILFPVARYLIKLTLSKLNLWKEKVIILGAKAGKIIAKGINSNSVLGYQVVGFLDDNKKRNEEVEKIKVLGKISEVEKWAKELKVKNFIIALPELQRERLVKIVKKCEELGETIKIIPNAVELITIDMEIENLGETLILTVRQNLTKPWNILIKNIFDYLVSFILIILLLPFFGLISLAILIDSPGPVILTQERLGKDRRKFKFYKFRSMYKDADSRLEAYLSKNPDALREWNKYQKLRGYDPRVTRVGKFLRKYSLDEFPQLFNVLKGDMSLVGPRPYLPREINKIGGSHSVISRVKPGLTGLWQVRGRNILPFKERLILDEYYVRNWSLWLDIVIFIKTLKILVTGEGAY